MIDYNPDMNHFDLNDLVEISQEASSESGQDHERFLTDISPSI